MQSLEDIAEELPTCTECSSNRSFEIKYSHSICSWDVDIPKDWTWGDMERISLYPVQVPIRFAECPDCNACYHVYPSFHIQGTKLTLQAVVLTGLIYERTALSWRRMVEQFCDEQDRISHSTLYRAGHSLGQLLTGNESAYRVAKKYLMGFDIPGGDSWPPMKSKYEHTRQREDNLRNFLHLLCILMLTSEFTTAFFRYLKQAHLFFSRIPPVLPPLYGKGKKGNPGNTS